MRLIDRFIDLSADAVAAGISVEDIGRLPVLRELRRMGEEIPNDEPERFDALGKALETAFMQLAARGAGDAG
jgi:V/A-type H+-transporting ATPase subunit A